MRLIPEIPFPSIKFLPGEGIHPAKAPQGTIQDRFYENIPFEKGFRFALDLFNAGYFWEVHEFLERYWHREKDESLRLVIQILIQLSALAIKKIKKQSGGVPGLLRAIKEKLQQLQAAKVQGYGGLELPQIAAWIDRWPEVMPEELRLSLIAEA